MRVGKQVGVLGGGVGAELSLMRPKDPGRAEGCTLPGHKGHLCCSALLRATPLIPPPWSKELSSTHGDSPCQKWPLGHWAETL